MWYDLQNFFHRCISPWEKGINQMAVPVSLSHVTDHSTCLLVMCLVIWEWQSGEHLGTDSWNTFFLLNQLTHCLQTQGQQVGTDPGMAEIPWAWLLRDDVWLSQQHTLSQCCTPTNRWHTDLNIHSPAHPNTHTFSLITFNSFWIPT